MSGKAGVLVSQKRTNTASASFKMVMCRSIIFHLPRHAIEPSRERGLQAVGAIGRKMGSKRRFDDKGLGQSGLSVQSGSVQSACNRGQSGISSSAALVSSPP